MKCRDCEHCKLGWFAHRPSNYVCVGVKEPFIIDNINRQCTEYPEKRDVISVESAIAHFKYGIDHDIFEEPVTSYAKMAVEALENNERERYKADLRMIKVNLIKRLRAKQRGCLELYDEHMDGEDYRNAQLLEEVIDLVKEML